MANICLCLCNSDDINKSPEDANYTVDILTRCAVSRDELSKKTIKIVPLKDPGEPVVVSVPVSQVSCQLSLYSQIFALSPPLVLVFLISS